MGPEVFVVASSVILGCVLVFLTVVTQVQVHTATCLAAAWTSARAVLCLRLRARFRRNDGTSGPATSRDRQAPGKRARRTERRRLKRALINENSESSDPVQCGQHSRWYHQKESLLLAATRPDSLPHPCSGCKIVCAKKNCSYNCCARCCRTQTRSVCRAHGTGYQAATEAVEGAVQYKYHEFDLSYGHLKACPPRVTSIGKQLVSLNLSNNRLSQLPDDIGDLSSLKELFLQYNNLTQVPDSVCKLFHLVELDIKNNRLSELPRKIGKLRHLVILNVTNNCLSQLPSSLGSLARLEELGLHSNHLTELPDELCNLTSLKVVYSGENRLKILPARLGQLVGLQELDVSGCELESLPESLSHCTCIIRLWLSNNRLRTLPVHIGNLQQLKELHVRNNRLKYLPASIEQLQLYTFTAQNNCFVDEHTARKMCHAPKDTLPSLMEISARAVLGYDIPWVSSSLPLCIEEMLSHPMRCSVCEGPFFRFFSSRVAFKTFGVFYRVPLCQYFCSPHLTHCSHKP